MEHLKKERQGLKTQIKLHQNVLREEKKKFSLLQKEVDKMAKLMADAEVNESGDDDNDDGDNNGDDYHDENDETESEEESESEESEEDVLPNVDNEEIPTDIRKINLQVNHKE